MIERNEQVQIMGQGLDKAFEELDIVVTKNVETPVEKYQVWTLSPSEFEKLDAADRWDDDFGWWRRVESTYTGDKTTEYLVNGKTMHGYIIDRDEVFDDDGESIYKVLEDEEYKGFYEWLNTVMNLSTETNTVAMATSLSKDNGMTLAEFVRKYQN